VPVLHAIVLGITQGLTEFLPISSSGHLVLVRWALGWDELSPGLAKTFDVALHVGTFVGAAAYFRDDLVRYARAGWRLLRRRGAGPDGRTALLLAVSALPAAAVGGLAGDAVETRLGQVWLIAAMLAAFGLALLWADRLPGRRGEKEFSVRDALVMGAAQALALQPGVSRSGATITAARTLGFDRDAAARLSFLMSLPVIAGAGVYKGADVVAGTGIPSSMVAPFAWGVATSALCGFAAVWAILRLVRTRSFAPFVGYRLVVAVAVLVAVALRG
jgi:undecaprenyl-diphosphatase